jgi:hypothetical protein
MGKIAGIWSRVQQALFQVQECLPPLTEQQRRLVMVLEVVRVEEHIPAGCLQWLGRRRADRKALARAFVAKASLNLATTKLLIERLRVDRSLRQLCGWEQGRQVPSESTFSRAFAEFAARGLLDRVHEARVKEYLKEEQVWHVARDSTEIEAREKPAARPAAQGRSAPAQAGEANRATTRAACGGGTGRVAQSLRRGHEEELQGPQASLGGLQVSC